MGQVTAHVSSPENAGVQAVLLAAGAGRRMGLPKALLRDAAGRSLVEIQVAKLGQIDAHPIVVVGARAEEVAALVPSGARIVECPEWQRGMGESLAAGLRAVAAVTEGLEHGARPHSVGGIPAPRGRVAVAALVMLVDLVDVPASAIARLSAHATPQSLARAAWNGVPGHPALIGRDHLPAAIAACHDDVGARALFAGAADAKNGAGTAGALIECGDLVAQGHDGAFDVDTIDQAALRGLRRPTAESVPAAKSGKEGTP